jgi:hypothetical protein
VTPPAHVTDGLRGDPRGIPIDRALRGHKTRYLPAVPSDRHFLAMLDQVE